MKIGEPKRTIYIPKPEPIRIPFPVKTPEKIPVVPKRKDKAA